MMETEVWVKEGTVGSIHIPTGSDVALVMTANGPERHDECTKDLRNNLVVIKAAEQAAEQENKN